MRAAALLLLAVLAPARPLEPAQQWTRHSIDNTSRGADGVRVVGFKPLSLVTGWEEAGIVRLYTPGTDVKEPWKREEVGLAGNVEDAVSAFGYIISASEGKTRALQVHRRRNGQWSTAKIPAAEGLMQWMFTLPVGDKLFAGGKGPNAKVGYFTTAKRLEDWRWTPLVDAGWIMSMVAADMDGDGDKDVLVSDRHGAAPGVYWLEAPGWTPHRVGPLRDKTMFLTLDDIDGDGDQDIVAATQPGALVIHKRLDKSGDRWETSEVPLPPIAGLAKAVRYFGGGEFVVTCEAARAPKHGVFLMKLDGSWRPVSGVDGVKHDLIELIDLDGDGDLDVITTEETTGLGVIWYENPARRR
jgi:hypothetical protein